MNSKKYLVIMTFDLLGAIFSSFLYKVNGDWWHLVLSVILLICALAMYKLWYDDNYIELPDWAKPYFEDK